MSRTTQANLFALGAIALWASLATLGVALSHVPAFALTGLALIIGSVPTWGHWRQWRVSPRALALGVYGLFGFHFLLFIALRHAPPVQANLVNYLWPLFIVVLAPLMLPGLRLHTVHVLAAALGFLGAGLAILGGRSIEAAWAWGYVPALGSALVWATFSLGSRRMAQTGQGFPT
ncbi:MAG: DMT family transporter, partial [Thiomonas sp.]|nr:DMT family transporter [Thiomonas sp.]